MSDWNRAPRGAGPRTALIAAAAVVLLAGAFIIGRVSAPTAAGGTAGTADSGAQPTADSATVPWKGGPGLGAPADARDDGKGWRVPAVSAKSGPTAVTDAGVPHGYTRSSDGVLLAAINASVATNWMRYTYPDPWAALGVLVASTPLAQEGKEALQARFSVKRYADPNAPVGQTPSASKPKTSARPCSCGLAVLGAKLQDGDPTTADMVTVAVEFVDFSTARGDDAPTMTLRVQTFGMAWDDGDWKVATMADQADGIPVVAAQVPAAVPLPAEQWRR